MNIAMKEMLTACMYQANCEYVNKGDQVMESYFNMTMMNDYMKPYRALTDWWIEVYLLLDPARHNEDTAAQTLVKRLLKASSASPFPEDQLGVMSRMFVLFATFISPKL